MEKQNFIAKLAAAVKDKPQWFALGFLAMAAVQYFFLTPSIWPVRAPENPVTAVDWVFGFLFALFTGLFLAAHKHRKGGPKVCKATGGIGSFIGIWGATCPFCSFFILVWLGIPAAAGVGSAAFLEPYLDIIRLAALAVMAYGLKLTLR